MIPVAKKAALRRFLVLSCLWLLCATSSTAQEVVDASRSPLPDQESAGKNGGTTGEKVTPATPAHEKLLENGSTEAAEEASPQEKDEKAAPPQEEPLPGDKPPGDKAVPSEDMPETGELPEAEDVPTEESAGEDASEGADEIEGVLEISKRPQKPFEIRLSISDAVALALDRNLDLRLAAADRRMAGHDVSVERAAFDPFFTMGSSYSKNRRPTASFLDIGGGALQPVVQANPTEFLDWSVGFRGLTPLGTDYSIELNETSFDRPRASGTLFGINPQVTAAASARLTQPLLKGAWWNYNTGPLRIARINHRISAETLELTAMDVVLAVEQAYWNLVFSLKNYESKANALMVASQDLQNARRRQEVGTLAPIDVTITESQVALRKVEFNEAEILFEDSRDALLDLLNHSSGSPLEGRWRLRADSRPYDSVLIIPTTEPDSAPVVPERAASLDLAFQRRPDYRRIDLEIENQEIRTQLTRNEMLPQLDLTGGWEQQGLDDDYDQSFSSLESGRFYSWSLGIQLEIPILNRAPRHLYLKAQEELRKTHLRKTQVENEIVLEVDQSIRKLRLLSRRLRDLEDRVRLQEAILEAERRKLQVGKSIDYTVSTIENDLIDSQAEALRANADYQTAKAEYHYATGTLLEKHMIEVER